MAPHRPTSRKRSADESVRSLPLDESVRSLPLRGASESSYTDIRAAQLRQRVEDLARASKGDMPVDYVSALRGSLHEPEAAKITRSWQPIFRNKLLLEPMLASGPSVKAYCHLLLQQLEQRDLQLKNLQAEFQAACAQNAYLREQQQLDASASGRSTAPSGRSTPVQAVPSDVLAEAAALLELSTPVPGPEPLPKTAPEPVKPFAGLQSDLGTAPRVQGARAFTGLAQGIGTQGMPDSKTNLKQEALHDAYLHNSAVMTPSMRLLLEQMCTPSPGASQMHITTLFDYHNDSRTNGSASASLHRTASHPTSAITAGLRV